MKNIFFMVGCSLAVKAIYISSGVTMPTPETVSLVIIIIAAFITDCADLINKKP